MFCTHLLWGRARPRGGECGIAAVARWGGGWLKWARSGWLRPLGNLHIICLVAALGVLFVFLLVVTFFVFPSCCFFPRIIVSSNRFRIQCPPSPAPSQVATCLFPGLLGRMPFVNLVGGPCPVFAIISNIKCIFAYEKVNRSLNRTSSYMSGHSRLWI